MWPLSAANRSKCIQSFEKLEFIHREERTVRYLILFLVARLSRCRARIQHAGVQIQRSLQRCCNCASHGTVNAHMVSFKFYKSSLWIVLFVEQHLTYISHRACMPLSAIGLKPYYFNTQSCVICAMHVGEVVKCRTETSEMEKKNPLRFSHYSVSNLGSPLSFIMCINPLSCGVGAGAQGRRGAVTDSVRFFKKGNCITLIEEPLSALKASAFSAQATFTHQYFLCCFTTVFLALITCSP